MTTPRLELDLSRWSAGELTESEMLARHGREAAVLMELDRRLTRVGSMPTPDHRAGWAALIERLAADVVRLRPRRGRRRVLALLVAAALAAGGSAIATVGAHRSTPPGRQAAVETHEHGGQRPGAVSHDRDTERSQRADAIQDEPQAGSEEHGSEDAAEGSEHDGGHGSEEADEDQVDPGGGEGDEGDGSDGSSGSQDGEHEG